MAEFPWKLTEDDAQSALFEGETGVERRMGVGEFAGLEFLHVKAQKVINPVSGNNLPFNYSINAYRGCSHACSYCFARPTHRFLEMGIGKDFDSRIVVKVNAVERLGAELASPKWNGDGIAMGTNTDPYQRAEGKYRLTRGIIEVLGEHRNPFSVLTKGTLIVRDIDVLTAAAERTHVECNFSVPTLDPDVWRSLEPGTPHPQQRINALARLSEAGIGCGVLVAPVVPGISDDEAGIRRVVDACVEAGARWIAVSPLHVKPGLREHWFEWLGEHYPGLVAEHDRLYADRSFLPKQRREEISMAGRAMVADARRRTGISGARRKSVMTSDVHSVSERQKAFEGVPTYQDALF